MSRKLATGRGRSTARIDLDYPRPYFYLPFPPVLLPLTPVLLPSPHPFRLFPFLLTTGTYRYPKLYLLFFEKHYAFFE